MAGLFGFLKPVTDFLDAAAPYVKTIGAAATVAGAVAPFFLEKDQLEAPKYEAPSASDLQSEAAAEANKKRRELARRKGYASTVRTPLGVGQDISVQKPDLLGV